MAEQLKPGSYVHVELAASDREKAKKFYGDIFGWKFQEVPEMNYTMFETPSGPGGGIRTPVKDDPGGILNHILVESIEETTPKITKAGGKILRPKEEIPGIGWWALFQDSVGNVQALYQPAPKTEQR